MVKSLIAVFVAIQIGLPQIVLAADQSQQNTIQSEVMDQKFEEAITIGQNMSRQDALNYAFDAYEQGLISAELYSEISENAHDDEKLQELAQKVGQQEFGQTFVGIGFWGAVGIGYLVAGAVAIVLIVSIATMV